MNSRLAAALAAGFALPVLAAWPVLAQRAGSLLLASIWVLALLRSAQGWGRHLVGRSRDGAEAPATWMVAAGLLVLAAASYLLGALGFFSRAAARLLEDARTGEDLRERLRSAGYTHIVVHEEARTDYERRFGYCSLDARSRDVLTQFLASRPSIFEQSGVRIHAL